MYQWMYQTEGLNAHSVGANEQRMHIAQAAMRDTTLNPALSRTVCWRVFCLRYDV